MRFKKKRAEIKRLLSLLEDKHRRGFKFMYATQPFDQDINLIVDGLPDKQVSQALLQCRNSYYSLFEILKNA